MRALGTGFSLRAENVHIQLDTRIPNSIVENEVRAIIDLYADLDAGGVSMSAFELEGGLLGGRSHRRIWKVRRPRDPMTRKR
ncbi:hypothetical protein Scep_010193 [Stephania cephalantha]|uniref:Uncharacterized protein n=1 Tax=Stephania cephalantha TaxID=152367 RepID=A0AAP0PDV7_9MAGN